MERALTSYIKKDLSKKIILLSGPRQCGKTTLSKMIYANKEDDFQYLNYDFEEHREIIHKKEWDRKRKLIIFDELHKMPKWKSWLKGVYDVEGISPKIIVTGSARLDTFKKIGDSLAGRYYLYHLFPFDLKELKPKDKDEAFNKLLDLGGFPEPYLNGSKEEYLRWKRTHLDIIIKQDLISLENVQNIISIQNLVGFLKNRVCGMISYHHLAQDLSLDSKTVKRYVDILESLFVIFKITPYSKKIKNAILKSPKIYFYDLGQVEGDPGVKLENLVALSLYKELRFLEDTKGVSFSLHYLRNKQGEEVDFVILINNEVKLLIECKWADDFFSSSLIKYKKNFPSARAIQLVYKLKNEKTRPDGIEMREVSSWLSSLDLNSLLIT